jgi:hypothetical protein
VRRRSPREPRGGADTIVRSARGPRAPRPHRPEAPDSLHRAADGSERAISGGAVATPDEAANEAALAILGQDLGCDWPRAWRLCDAFERELLAALNVMDELSIDAAAVAAWVAAREKS